MSKYKPPGLQLISALALSALLPVACGGQYDGGGSDSDQPPRTGSGADVAPAGSAADSSSEHSSQPVPNAGLPTGIAPVGTPAGAAAVPYGGEQSGLYQALLAWQNRITARRLPSGKVSDTLSEYAAKCDVATGIHVPAFNCNAGVEPPGQGTTPRGSSCNEPNVLNGVCDPGSRFQVVAENANAVVVGHCRKDGLAVASTGYNDIAVVQYNKANGAACFYQALGYGSGPLSAQPAAPSDGQAAWSWLSPAATEGINCTGCHTNGALVRSEYLAQLSEMPNTGTGYDNNTPPLAFVGNDYGLNRTWSMNTARATGDTGLPCNTCHRLAVSNYQAFGLINGSGAHFALLATAASQASKVPHSATSPIWMRPGQVFYNANAEASAALFNGCATGFWSGQSDGFSGGTATSGCTFTPLGVPWTGFDPSQAASVVTSML